MSECAVIEARGCSEGSLVCGRSEKEGVLLLSLNAFEDVKPDGHGERFFLGQELPLGIRQVCKFRRERLVISIESFDEKRRVLPLQWPAEPVFGRQAAGLRCAYSISWIGSTCASGAGIVCLAFLSDIVIDPLDLPESVQQRAPPDRAYSRY